ncbi:MULTISPECIES: hypothetical protein [unclassified Microbacterium]|uniref:hypothetical protein n=1 Tax=unclassified Microbacterium TaxID=2609290 RepID=UPI0012FB7775|nr:hypothetical protein [Microbacterium sp. MAH-37]MVQ41402.1 hypothetical protein [Microbacterium sp. MAH-37]
MSTANFPSLVRAVVSSSVSNSWHVAKDEWAVTGVEEDPQGDGVCVCGQMGLVSLFTITNTHNGSELFPIGSTCVNQFGRKDLNSAINVLADLLKLRGLVRAGKSIPFTAEYFSRAMLEDLYEEGAFTPDQYNSGDGQKDYDFLLKMFNKRNKDDISTAQRRKISVLVNQKIRPFLDADPRLG